MAKIETAPAVTEKHVTAAQCQPNYAYHEFNLLKMPIFLVDKQQTGKPGIIEIVVKNENNIGKWKVSSNIEYGLGGPFDDAVFMVLSKHLSELPKPVSNPVDIGSLRSIAKRMGINSPGKAVFTAIKTSIKRMTSLLITSENAFFDKSKKRCLLAGEGSFHILNQSCFVNEQLADGEVAESNYVWFPETLLGNINKGYVCPIDMDLYFNLRTDIARALMKFLAEPFHAVRNIPNGRAQYRYSNICQRTTIKRREYLSLAKQQLDTAHDELVAKGFLDSYQWKPAVNEKNDWIVMYRPGKMANKTKKVNHNNMIDTLKI